MAVMITCPACQRSMKGPDSIIGKTVKCPACMTQFSVTGTPPPPAIEPQPMLAPLAEDYPVPYAPQARSTPGSNQIVEFLLFRRMGTPVLIHVVFWPMVIFQLYWGIAFIWDSFGGKKQMELLGQKAVVETKFSFRELILGLAIFLLGPIIWRVYCETMLIFFRMSNTLSEIREGIDGLRKD